MATGSSIKPEKLPGAPLRSMSKAGARRSGDEVNKGGIRPSTGQSTPRTVLETDPVPLQVGQERNSNVIVFEFITNC